MAMKTKAYRGLDKLNSNFRKKVELFLKEAGKDIFVTESWRTQERQNELLSLGLSQVKHSNHQDGLAIDIGFTGNELYPSDYQKWRKIADIAKKYGIDWGYDLWKWDKPHFQDSGKPILEANFSKMTQYTEIMQNTLKTNNLDPIFDSHDGGDQIVKELVEIGLARVRVKNNLK